VLNLVIAVLSLLIGVVSDLAGLRLAFGGVVLVMYTLGILVSLPCYAITAAISIAGMRL